MSKKPILEVLASVPHSVGSKRKASSWLRSSPDELDGGADEHLDATMVAKEHSESNDSGEPGESQSRPTASQGGPTYIRLVRGDRMATPTHIHTQPRWWVLFFALLFLHRAEQ